MPNDWHLSYPGADLPFGSVASGYVFTKAPDLGAADIETDDATRPRADGVMFGADYFGGRTIGFDIAVNGASELDARARLSVLTQAWRADAVRRTPGAVATLTADTGRLTFGRPRRFASVDTYLPDGLTDVVADFACADPLWYGVENLSTVALAPPPGGGLIAPLAEPLATTPTSDRSTALVVGGEVPTWPVFEIAGPITNPTVEIVGLFKMEFRTTLAYDETLVVDTRPWARTILRNGASVAGSLTRTSARLSQASIPPGAYEMVLRGSSEPGTAYVRALWRDAYLTP
jgi:hypothetical protein